MKTPQPPLPFWGMLWGTPPRPSSVKPGLELGAENGQTHHSCSVWDQILTFGKGDAAENPQELPAAPLPPTPGRCAPPGSAQPGAVGAGSAPWVPDRPRGSQGLLTLGILVGNDPKGNKNVPG